MPPASLSTLEVMSPGPTTARSNTNLWRSPRMRFRISLPRLRRLSRWGLSTFRLMIFRLLSDFFGHFGEGMLPAFLVENELSVSKREIYSVRIQQGHNQERKKSFLMS